MSRFNRHRDNDMSLVDEWELRKIERQITSEIESEARYIIFARIVTWVVVGGCTLTLALVLFL